MNSQGFYGFPNFFGIFDVEIRMTQKMLYYIAHENCRNVGYARFDACLTFKMGWNVREGQPDRYPRS